MTERLSIQKLRELLKQERYKKVINEDGSVVTPKSAIFSEISDIIGKSDPLSAKNIYTILKLNRYKMHTFILDFYCITYDKELPVNSSIEDSSNRTLLFTIDVRTIWNDIEVEEVIYNSKNKNQTPICTLKRRTWSNYLFEEIFKITQLKCALTFKRNKLTETGYAVKIAAFCSECGSTSTGCVANKPINNQPILMDCELKNYNQNFLHKKKRQLKGSKREEVGKELALNKISAAIWRRKEADKLMKYGDNEPPHLFRLNTLRKAKQQRQDELLNIKSKNVYESLHSIKYNPEFEGAIRSIGLDPFCIHYFSNEQIAVFEKHHDTLLIDATGSLVKKIKLPNGELGPHLFLYQCVAKIPNSTFVPVCQMVSAAQNTNTISYWLFEFLRIGSTHKSTFPIPKEVVTDFSKALLGAVCRAFAKKNSLSDYLTYCFKLILGNETKLLPSLIRLDICHFMNMIAKWNCWRGSQKRLKQFYLRSFAALREQDSLRGIEEHAEAIFIISLNESLSHDGLVNQSKQFLCNSIRGVVVEDKYLNIAEHDNDFYEIDAADSDIFKWTHDIFKKCKNKYADRNESSIDLNPFFCPSVAENLKKILPYFPLFSDVMLPIFKYGTKRPTSSGVEAEFNDLKNRVLRDVATLRVDKFIVRHIHSFPGKLKIAIANEDLLNEENVYAFNDSKKADGLNEENFEANTTNNSEKGAREDSLGELQEEENWRNKNNHATYSKYVDHMPEFDSEKATTGLPVILNGYLCKNIRQKEKIFFLANTCVFDSICQIFATALKNYSKYFKIIEKRKIPIFKVALTLLKHGLKNNSFYTERAKLFYNLPIYNAKETRSNIVKIDGNTNIGNLANSLFVNFPSCIISHMCTKCNKTVSRNYVTIPTNFELLSKGFHMMKESVNGAFSEPKKCCEITTLRNIDYGPHLLIETDLGIDHKTVLGTIPLTLNLTEMESYNLAGIVAYSGTFKLNSVGHYTAYIPISHYWLQFDDTSANSALKRLNKECTIYAHLCIYIIN